MSTSSSSGRPTNHQKDWLIDSIMDNASKLTNNEQVKKQIEETRKELKDKNNNE